MMGDDERLSFSGALIFILIILIVVTLVFLAVSVASDFRRALLHRQEFIALCLDDNEHARKFLDSKCYEYQGKNWEIVMEYKPKQKGKFNKAAIEKGLDNEWQ